MSLHCLISGTVLHNIERIFGSVANLAVHCRSLLEEANDLDGTTQISADLD